MSQVFFNNINSDGLSDPYLSKGGKAVLNVRFDSLGGGTINLLIASSNDPLERFEVMSNGSLTSSASLTLDYLPVGILLKVELTGSVGASNVFVDILQ